jgi:hypothetical protein
MVNLLTRVALHAAAAIAVRRQPSPADVTITDASLAAYVRAADAVGRYRAAHPGERVLTNESFDSFDAAAKSLCERRPPLRDAIVAAGLTCVRFFVYTARLELVTSGATTGPEAAALRITPGEVAFVRAHADTIAHALDEIGAGEGTAR